MSSFSRPLSKSLSVPAHLLLSAWLCIPHVVAVSRPAAADEIAGVFGAVHALTVYKGDLIAGGEFVTANDITPNEVTVNGIARWDGARWHALGPGMNGPVYALTVLGDSLIAGGDFDQIGNLVVGNIATWNGSEWASVGLGTNGPVHALTTRYDIFVIAGGDFTMAGAAPALGVAQWFANNWRPVGDGLEGTVRSLVVSSGRLVAAGEDVRVPGAFLHDRFIVEYTDRWRGINPAADGPLHVVQDMNGGLVAGGRFRMVWWSTNGYSVGQQIGNRWQPLSLGMWIGATRDTAEVFAMATYNGGLAAGGIFDHASGMPANNVAWLDDTRWNALGNATTGGGTNGKVLALVEYNGKLVVGGEFTSVNGVATRNIAAWDGTSWNDPLTPVTLSDMRIDATSERVRLEWRLDDASVAELRSVIVERATTALGPFEAQSAKLRPAPIMSWVDSASGPGAIHWYRLRLTSRRGPASATTPIRVESAPRTVANALQAVDPGGREPVLIRYELAARADVQLVLFDAAGRRLRVLESGFAPPGAYVRTWDRHDSHGRPVSRGVYFVTLTAGQSRTTRKLVLLSK